MKHTICLLLIVASILPLRSQTVELIKMPLPELQAKVASGDPSATLQLALRHNLGMGVPYSMAKTKELMLKVSKDLATAAGICARLGFNGKPDPDYAFTNFKKAADTGDITAIRNLGICYQSGIGCAVDKAKAFELLQEAAKTEDPAALYYLGRAYLSKGVAPEKDPAKAVEIWEKITPACTLVLLELADCYERGIGCIKDDGHAVDLLNQAADAQDCIALRRLGARYYNGDIVEKNVGKAHDFFRKAGELGDGKALFWLGNDYFEGSGVEKSFAAGEEL